jgi:seryl-tRNA synthetase
VVNFLSLDLFDIKIFLSFPYHLKKDVPLQKVINMELADVVNRIELKIKGIKERLNSLQEENKALSEQVATLLQSLEEREFLIKEYEQISNINNINITTNNIGSEKAKQKIEDLMREIDKCITLLQ